jgi:hypothetical protein
MLGRMWDRTFSRREFTAVELVSEGIHCDLLLGLNSAGLAIYAWLALMFLEIQVPERMKINS